MLRLVPFASRNTLGAFDPFFDADPFFASDSLNAFRADVKDTGKAYEIEMDMPGFKKEDIHLDVENGFLKVTAERRASSEEKDKDGGVLRSERLFGSFSRSFDLAGVQEADITASYDGGVLKLVLPKKEETLPASRRVEIQ
ncbi:MAG: Hsp20/alpha crystallin family protein [Eubacteriales bacterium]